MEKVTQNKILRTTPHASEVDYRAQGLRILARMIAQAYLRNSQFKGKAGNKRRERKNK